MTGGVIFFAFGFVLGKKKQKYSARPSPIILFHYNIIKFYLKMMILDNIKNYGKIKKLNFQGK